MGNGNGIDNDSDPDELILEEDSLEDLAMALRTNRRERGPTAADKDWFAKPFEAWMAALDDETDVLSGESMATLAVGMTEVLAMRDAIILSMIIDDPYVDRESLLCFACHPHRVRSARRMESLLFKAYHGRDSQPDHGRCMRGVGMLMTMICLLPGRFRIQPLAVVAYMLWWVGDRRAEEYAVRCLEQDEDCSLAAIVLCALLSGAAPRWLDGQGKRGNNRPCEMVNSNS